MAQNPTKNNRKTGLTPTQEKVAILLANGESISNIAEQLNLNRSTIYDWKSTLIFKCFYNLQCKEAKENLINGLNGMYKEAFETIQDILKNGNDNARLKTAFEIISRVERRGIGETEPRKILKNQATIKENVYEMLDYGEEKVTFDEEK